MADPEPSRWRHEQHVKENGGWGGEGRTIEVTGLGSLFINVCMTCHWIETTCNHSKNEWRDEPKPDKPDETWQVLRCLLCGIDGT